LARGQALADVSVGQMTSMVQAAVEDAVGDSTFTVAVTSMTEAVVQQEGAAPGQPADAAATPSAEREHASPPANASDAPKEEEEEEEEDWDPPPPPSSKLPLPM